MRASCLRAVVFAAVYAVAALVGRATVLDGTTLNLIWPAAGVAALWAVLHRERPTRWLDAGLLLVTAFVVNVATGTPVALATALAGINLLQAVVFAVRLHQRSRPEQAGTGPLLLDMRGLWALLAATGSATTVGAWLGAAAVYATTDSWSFVELLVWQARNAVAILVIVPLGLRVRQLLLQRRGALAATEAAPFQVPSRWRAAELALAVIISIAGNMLVFLVLPGYPIAFPLFAITAWVALRFDTALTTLRTTVVSVVAVAFTLAENGPFASIADLAVQALVVQIYAGLGAVLALALALSRDERRVLLARVRQAADEATAQAHSVQVLADASRTVLLSDDARTAVCQAVLDVSGADGVYLIEPDGDEHLMSTTVIGTDLPPLRLSADPATSVTARLFADGSAVFLSDLSEASGVARELVDYLSIRSAFWQPVVVPGGHTVAMIGVVWHEQVLELPAGTPQVLDVLSREAARAIERGNLLEQLARAADRDQLTGLANRRRWDESITTEVSRAQRTGQPLTALLIDLDHFKQFNDAFGHLAGDVLLRSFAAAAQTCLRDADLIARWGGEEFAVALPDCTAEAALAVADRIRASVPSGRTCTIGVAEWVPGEGPAEVLARADAALYAGKRGGRDTAVVAAAPAVVTTGVPA